MDDQPNVTPGTDENTGGEEQKEGGDEATSEAPSAE